MRTIKLITDITSFRTGDIFIPSVIESPITCIVSCSSSEPMFIDTEKLLSLKSKYKATMRNEVVGKMIPFLKIKELTQINTK